MNEMKRQASPTVLDDDVFPIAGWAGLSGDRITSETMRDMRDGSWAKPYPRRPENQPLTLAPGEGRLLRFGGEGQSRF